MCVKQRFFFLLCILLVNGKLFFLFFGKQVPTTTAVGPRFLQMTGTAKKKKNDVISSFSDQ